MSITTRAQDLEKILVFKILKNVKDNFKTVDNFKKHFSKIQHQKATHDEIVKFCSMFSLELKGLRTICGNGNIENTMSQLPEYIKHQKNFTRHYKSGKHFAVHSYFYIEWNILEQLFNNEQIFDIKSNFYTDRQRKLAFKVIFKTTIHKAKKQKGKDMKIQTPANDIEFDEQPIKKHHIGLTADQQKFVDKMQDWVNEKALGILTARAMLKDIGKGNYAKQLEEPRGGASIQEMNMERMAKIEIFFFELFKDMLDEKAHKKWHMTSVQQNNFLKMNAQ